MDDNELRKRKFFSKMILDQLYDDFQWTKLKE